MAVSDYRSDPMPSAEGHGRARGRWQRAWDAYTKALGPVVEPAVLPAARWLATRRVEGLVGFWLLWHLEGGFGGLERLGMSRSSIYRRIATFRSSFGVHPDEYEMPGVSIDLEEYLRRTRRADAEQ